MQVPLKLTVILIILVSTAVGLIAYWYAKETIPAKVEIQEKEVIKEVEVIKRDVRIVERKVEKPDGTVEYEKVTEDKSQEKVKKESASESQVVMDHRSKWEVGYIGGARLGSGTALEWTHGVYGMRRVMGNVKMGIYGQSNGAAGVMVGIEF